MIPKKKMRGKNILYAAFWLLMMTSCLCKKQTKKKYANDFINNILDDVIQAKANKPIEFPELYNSLVSQIADDSHEKLILVEALKKRGFKLVDWSRGNYPPLGARIVCISMVKDSCLCEIYKIYYFTHLDTVYLPTERIKCLDAASHLK